MTPRLSAARLAMIAAIDLNTPTHANVRDGAIQALRTAAEELDAAAFESGKLSVVQQPDSGTPGVDVSTAAVFDPNRVVPDTKNVEVTGVIVSESVGQHFDPSSTEKAHADKYFEDAKVDVAQNAYTGETVTADRIPEGAELFQGADGTLFYDPEAVEALGGLKPLVTDPPPASPPTRASKKSSGKK